MATMTQTTQDVTSDWADLTTQMQHATGRTFRITCQDGLVRLERHRTGEWKAVTGWMTADTMELYADAYLNGIHEGYLAAKSGH